MNICHAILLANPCTFFTCHNTGNEYEVESPVRSMIYKQVRRAGPNYNQSIPYPNPAKSLILCLIFNLMLGIKQSAYFFTGVLQLLKNVDQYNNIMYV